ncbi:MAG: mechanosensitive ion channel domain-containing protein [Glaciecola sp.]
MDNIVLHDWLVFLLTTSVSGSVVFIARWIILIKHTELSAEQRLPRQLLLLLITIFALIAIVLSLPVQESSRNQLLGLLGVLLSGVIAFSSTTIVSNLMAGIVLSVNRPFRTGDFIRCNTFAGRVTEKGLLDTEIQTEQRTLIHIANSFLINHPVEVVRSSGTFVSAEVSLGYDVHHSTIENHLLQAAKKAGLNDAFVHVTALGDFSVNYKVSGMLLDTKSMLTTRSALHTCMLDELHNNDIEILSPNFVAQRPTDAKQTFLAKAHTNETRANVNQEDLAFDKADEAELIDTQKQQLSTELEALKLSLGELDADAKAVVKQKMANLQQALAELEESNKN